ncbi:polysaccharide deacetylase family protein [Cellulomonas sp. DKR-3]|uniref:Polysaccharide deacetylase family protein n=1 Tax=Cellulomonas fulva TaxID=2835530 RepID=A0ABS5TWS1_9CELL|nr:polysaccharide deacetylase family protein [Cellulomonas fulva]MBT0993547.1 polysaccharide deacetylase family protein [Cellulomonas fulva]
MATPHPSDALVVSTRSGGQTLGLTFDDGPHADNTPALLAVLAEHDVKAVFFVCGENVRAHPQIVRDIVAGGHVLGNHSTHHDDLGTWPADAVEADLRATDEAVRDAAPGAPVPFFRAPYGHWGVTPQVASGLGMRSVAWAYDIGDWDPPSADELLARLLTGVEPGAVVLLHDGGGDRTPTVEAVARFIPLMRARGWSFDLPAGAD